MKSVQQRTWISDTVDNVTGFIEMKHLSIVCFQYPNKKVVWAKKFDKNEGDNRKKVYFRIYDV